jgi:hydroxymethylpyrimidine/phosphomethylpyrimidine kinase
VGPTGGGTPPSPGVDVLVDADGTHLLRHPAVPTENDHGTGCTFSAALAALLARGLPLAEAARGAQGFVARALHTSKDWRLGRGRGPVAHTHHHHTKES